MQILIRENNIFILTGRRVTCWPLPTLKVMETPFTLRLLELIAFRFPRERPVFSIELDALARTPVEFSKAHRVRAISFPLVHQRPGPLSFDLMWSLDDYGNGVCVQVERYQFNQNQSDESSNSLCILASWECSQVHYQERLSLSSASFANLIPHTIAHMKPMHWMTLDTRWFDFAVVVAATGEVADKVEWRIMNLVDPFDTEPLREGWDVRQYSLPCIASGRIAYLTGRRGNTRPSELRYMDF